MALALALLSAPFALALVPLANAIHSPGLWHSAGALLDFEALVGAAFAIPPALGGLAARWTRAPESIFWMGAVVAVLAGIAQQLARARDRDVVQQR